jgi:hypothetical protein
MSGGLSGAAVRWSAAVLAASFLFSPVAQAVSPDFTAYLAEGYHQLARQAGKGALAQFYAKRSAAAAAGQAPEPVKPDKATPDAVGVGELSAVRDKLIESLDAGGRERQPLLAAIAQINFDCWAKPLPKRKGAPRSIDCHSRFLLAFQGLPDKRHRGPISSVEAWQFAELSPAKDAGSLARRAAGSGDSIGTLILSLSSPAMPQGGATYDAALAATYVVGNRPGDDSVMGSCDQGCLPMDFSGPGTAPLIAALTTRDKTFEGLGNSKAGSQSANADGSNGNSAGAAGTGGSGGLSSGNNGPGNGSTGGSAGSGGSTGGSAGGGSSSGGPAGGGGFGGPAGPAGSSSGGSSGSSGSGSSGSGGGDSDSGDGGDGSGGSGHGQGHHNN